MTLILSRSDVVDLLSLPECIDAACAFRLHAEGRTLGPGVLGVPAFGRRLPYQGRGLGGLAARLPAVDIATTSGTASPSACGHATTMTVTVRSTATSRLVPTASQAPSVTAPPPSSRLSCPSPLSQLFGTRMLTSQSSSAPTT